MIRVKDRNYYVGEQEIKKVYQDKNGKFIAIDKYDNRLEIDEKDYKTLGGKWNGRLCATNRPI